jgi:hypothetical protein
LAELHEGLHKLGLGGFGRRIAKLFESGEFGVELRLGSMGQGIPQEFRSELVESIPCRLQPNEDAGIPVRLSSIIIIIGRSSLQA